MLTNYQSLSYGACPLEMGNRPPNDVGTTYVVHLVTEDIYLQLTLTAWGGGGGNGQTSFSYTRTTPAPAPPTPTVSITDPTNGSSFAAPADVTLTADAAVSTGTVTNVEFLHQWRGVGIRDGNAVHNYRQQSSSRRLCADSGGDGSGGFRNFRCGKYQCNVCSGGTDRVHYESCRRHELRCAGKRRYYGKRHGERRHGD